MDIYLMKLIVGQFVNSYGYFDIIFFEILFVIKGGGKIIICMMEVQFLFSFKLKFVIGGFLVYCENNGEQKWVISFDFINGEFFVIWCKDGIYSFVFGRYKIEDMLRKFYDYNF